MDTPSFSIGIEEEYQIIDPASGELKSYITELLEAKPKPVIMSCRRPRDGGAWDGSEEERLALLRQCIISKADYVEIELDVADQIRPFPPSQRVISARNAGSAGSLVLRAHGA